MRIAPTTGNVGIGTTTPSERLAVDGNGLFTGVLNIQGTATSTFSGGISIGQSSNALINSSGRIYGAGLYVNRRFDQGEPSGGIYFINSTGTGYVRAIYYSHNSSALTFDSQNINMNLSKAEWTASSGDGWTFRSGGLNNASLVLLGSTGGAAATLNIGSTQQRGLVVKGVNNQSGDYFNVSSNSNEGDIFTIESNGNVGIGTSSPLARLDVVGDAGGNPAFRVSSSTNETMFVVNANGNVGIGTTSPTSKLTFEAATTTEGGIVFGDVGLYRRAAGRLTTTGDFSINQGRNLYFIDPAAYLFPSYIGHDGGNAFNFQILGGNGVNFRTTQGSNTLIKFTSDGRIGIGTTSPIARLSIVGSGSTDAFLIASSTGSTAFRVQANNGAVIGSSGSAGANGLYVGGRLNIGTPNGVFTAEFIENNGSGRMSFNAGNGYSFSGGAVGIGTTTLGSLLTVAGTTTATVLNTTSGFINVGAQRYITMQGNMGGDVGHNFLVGQSAGSGLVPYDDTLTCDNSCTIEGSYNVMIGRNAGSGVSPGTLNTLFVGNNAGFGAQSTRDAVFIGREAGSGANASDVNFLGQFAGYQVTGVVDSNFFGRYAGYRADEASRSNFFGEDAGNLATNAAGSNFFGENAGYGATWAAMSNFFGLSAGENATSALRSNFFGPFAGYSAFTASDSNFFGPNAGQNASNAAYSNFLGWRSGRNAANAYNSTFLGPETGNNAANAASSIFIGVEAGKMIR